MNSCRPEPRFGPFPWQPKTWSDGVVGGRALPSTPIPEPLPQRIINQEQYLFEKISNLIKRIREGVTRQYEFSLLASVDGNSPMCATHKNKFINPH